MKKSSIKKKKSYHHGNLPETLIKATLELIESTRSTAFSIRDISKLAGVSHAAAYRHFAGRDEILAVVAERGFVTFKDYLKVAREGEGKNLLEAFRAQIEAYIRFALSHPIHFRLMFSNEARGLIQGRFEQAAAASFLEMQSLALELIESGQFRKIPIQQATTVIWSSIHGFSELVLNGFFSDSIKDADDAVKVSQLLSDNLLNGLCQK